MKKLSLSWLFQFQQLLEIGSFTETALKLNLSQQSLSRNMHELESWAGQPLILRLPGRLQLTPGGQQLYQALPELLSSLQQACQPVSHALSDQRIGISALWNQILPLSLLLKHLQSTPDLEIAPLGEPDILAFILAGELQLGLLGSDPGQGFQSLALPELNWILVGSPKLAQTKSLPYLSCDSPEHPDPLRAAHDALPIPAHCIGSVNSLHLLQEFLNSGICAGYLPWPLVKTAVQQGQLKIYHHLSVAPIKPYAVWLGELSPTLQNWLIALQEALSESL